MFKELKESVHVFRLENDFTYYTNIPLEREYSFNNFDGKELMHIWRDGRITIRAGYVWDGCSPKIRIWDLDFLGTPDGTMDPETGKRKCFYGTCIHDPLYKFSKDIPFTRKQVDGFMLDLFQKSKFSCARIYYIVVRALGWLYWK